ncbi:MAG: hemerythrin domain-containing protein [Armatimonadetes bacterium]|nr:hemerythrin domain-containing protein [Armatimonadota bacterium]
MKRHPALEPFSRDHNDGLHLARALRENRGTAPDDFRKAWKQDLSDHFQEEERILFPFCEPEWAQRMRNEHKQIENLSHRLPSSAIELGVALEDHIRWEERVLFPAIEARMGANDAQTIAKQSMVLEMRRWEHSPARELLVKRRMNID